MRWPPLAASVKPALISGLAALASMAFGITESQALPPRCPADLPDPKVVVDFDMGKVRYNIAADDKELKRLYAENRKGHTVAGASRSNRKLLGLTVADFRFRLSARYRHVKVAENRVCVVPVNVTITSKYEDIAVYINQHYRPGSCGFNQVLNHENDHVEVFQLNLAKLSHGIEKNLSRTLKQIVPVVGSSRAEAIQNAQRILGAAARKTLREYHRDTQQQTAALDTESNYQRIHKNCKNW